MLGRPAHRARLVASVCAVPVAPAIGAHLVPLIGHARLLRPTVWSSTAEACRATRTGRSARGNLRRQPLRLRTSRRQGQRRWQAGSDSRWLTSGGTTSGSGETSGGPRPLPRERSRRWVLGGKSGSSQCGGPRKRWRTSPGSRRLPLRGPVRGSREWCPRRTRRWRASRGSTRRRSGGGTSGGREDRNARRASPKGQPRWGVSQGTSGGLQCGGPTKRWRASRGG